MFVEPSTVKKTFPSDIEKERMIFMWWGPSGGWGMPFVMFIFPFFFIVCMGFMFFFFSRRMCPFGDYHKHRESLDRDELLEEIRKLRREVDELKKEKQK